MWLMLQAALGLEMDQGELVTEHLRLPIGLNYLHLEGLTTSKGRLAVELRRSRRGDEASDETRVELRELPENHETDALA